MPAAVVSMGKNLNKVFGGDEHRLVAGRGGLRRERVHRLRARDARNQLHGEAGEPARGERPHQIELSMRLQERHDGRVGTQSLHDVNLGWLDGEQQVGGGEHFARVAGDAGTLIGRVRQAGRDTRTRFDDDLGTVARESSRNLRHERNPCFARSCFSDYADTQAHRSHSVHIKPAD